MAKKKKTSKRTAAKAVRPVSERAKKAVAKETLGSRNNVRNLMTVGALADSLVPVTYVLTKSNDVEIQHLYIGDTKIELVVDQDPADPNKFLTKGSKRYMCIHDNSGLSVVLRSIGKAGGGWSLEINRSGTALSDNPIQVSIDHNGRADHNAYHN